MKSNQNAYRSSIDAVIPSQELDVSRDFFTPQQLAAALDISVRTLQQWHLLRKAPARIAHGKLRLYRKSAVSSWLTASEVAEPRRRA